MANVTLSLGFDIEQPNGNFARTSAGKELRKAQLPFVKNLLELLDSEKVPRTLFILGDYLTACLEDSGVTKEELMKIYEFKDRFNEIEQHGHVEKKNGSEITPEEFGYDIQSVEAVFRHALDIPQPMGIRLPSRYTRTEKEYISFLKELDDVGYRFVSSAQPRDVSVALNWENQPRSHKKYGFPKLIEVPTHGLKDIVFTKAIAQELYGDEEPAPAAELLKHQIGMLEKAIHMSKEKDGHPVSVAYCLHPWAMKEYDPKLQNLGNLISAAKRKGIEFATYSDVAERTRERIDEGAKK